MDVRMYGHTDEGKVALLELLSQLKKRFFLKLFPFSIDYNTDYKDIREVLPPERFF